MDISKEDVDKVNFIAIATQTNDLVTILMTMNKAALTDAINSVEPQNRGMMYRFMTHVLAFYNGVENEIRSEQNKQMEKENQGELFK
jgi:hypothetical protein